METTLLTAAFGAVFALVGRWLYKNPKRFFPGWGLLNPDNPKVQNLARLYATFFIFVGSLAFCVGITLLLSREFGVVLALILAFPVTWLLRPRKKEERTTSGAPVNGATSGDSQSQGFLTAHWKRNLSIVAGIAAVFVVVLFALIGDSEVCKLAYARAQSSSAVQQRLGEPIKRGFFVSGTIEILGPDGKADIEIPISGPKGKGTLYALARKSAGVWKFETLDATFDGGSERISILAKESAQPQ